MEQTTPCGCGCAHQAARPTQILSDEHRVIERVLNALEKLTKRPPGTSLSHWKTALDFFRHFADQCHHYKEEQVLFPAMEEHGIPREGGPIGMMLLEHEQGRAHVRAMSEAVEQLQTGRDAAEVLLSHARAYLTLLREHIQKEDDILFRMADEIIPEDEQRQLLRRFEAHESEEVGAGAHEKYLKVAAELEGAAA
jgi:hemerythrin-like domain-containing protein